MVVVETRQFLEDRAGFVLELLGAKPLSEQNDPDKLIELGLADTKPVADSSSAGETGKASTSAGSDEGASKKSETTLAELQEGAWTAYLCSRTWLWVLGLCGQSRLSRCRWDGHAKIAWLISL